MGDAAKTSPRAPSSSAQNAILSLLIIHIIPSRQIYVAMDDPLLVPSISCHTTISEMYFSQWKPPEVSERMWSVNLDASISGEYQTLGGHSCWPSE